MESKAKLFGHPIHQMLIVFPLGLLGMAALFDAIQWFSGDGDWSRHAYAMMGAGILSGLVAAVFGLIDYLAIPSNTRAKKIGMLHGGGNVIVTGMFILSWWLRRDNPGDPGTAALLLSIGGALLALVTGWLGGELVDRLAVGVDRGAHLNAPSSLSGRPAHESA